MSIPQTYYLNAPTLSTATGVFYDEFFSFIAPDGFYSDGAITREQVSGSLLPAQPCPTCFVSCPKELPVYSNGFNPTTDISSVLKYKVSINLGAGTGNAKITIGIGSAINPLAVLARIGTNEYNLIVEPGAGYYMSPVGGFTCVTWTPCTADSLNPFNIRDILYNYTINDWVDSGIVTTGNNADPSQTFTSTLISNYMNMFIPKPSATENILELEIYSFIPCNPPTTDFGFIIDCPANLPSATISDTPYNESALACSSTDDNQTVYIASATGALPTISLFDIAYTDVNGVFPVPSGWYYYYPDGITKTAIFIDPNGVITNIVTC